MAAPIDRGTKRQREARAADRAARRAMRVAEYTDRRTTNERPAAPVVDLDARRAARRDVASGA